MKKVNELHCRIDDETREQLGKLSEKFGSKSNVVRVGVAILAAQAASKLPTVSEQMIQHSIDKIKNADTTEALLEHGVDTRCNCAIKAPVNRGSLCARCGGTI